MTNGGKRITVAHIVQNLDVGGLERIVISLMKGIDSARYRSLLYCLEDGGALVNEVTRAGHGVEAMNKRPGLSYLLPMRLRKLMKRDRVDVVHCHNFGALVYGGISGRMAGSSGIVYTLHGPEIPSTRRQRILQRAPLADKITTISEHVRQSAIQKGGLDPKKVQTIVNGIDVKRFAESTDRLDKRAEIGVAHDDRLLGIVSRLTPEKDHNMLLEALSRVVPDHDSVKLIVVGDGVLKRTLEEKARELGLQNHVRFLGSRHDVPDILDTFDIFVLSSQEEGLGITLLEAMASGLPVVATNAGGIPEVVIHGETGLLVPRRDPERFAEAITWMLTHRDAARTMGRKGRERAAGHFEIGRMIAQYEAVYEELTARSGDGKVEVAPVGKVHSL